MKNTCYRPVVAIMASRDHLCCNPNLDHLKGRAKNIKCKELRSNMKGKSKEKFEMEDEMVRTANQEKLDLSSPS